MNRYVSVDYVEDMSQNVIRNVSVENLYRAARELRGITTQRKIAEMLGVTPAMLCNWKKEGVPAKHAVRAQALLGCDANWLLTGEGEMMGTRVSLTKLQQRVLDDLEALPQTEQEKWSLNLAEASIRHRKKTLEEKEKVPKAKAA